MGRRLGCPGDVSPMGLQLEKWNEAPWGAGGMPLALLSTLKRCFAMSFGLMCLFAIAVPAVIHMKNHRMYIDVMDMS